MSDGPYATRIPAPSIPPGEPCPCGASNPSIAWTTSPASQTSHCLPHRNAHRQKRAPAANAPVPHGRRGAAGALGRPQEDRRAGEGNRARDQRSGKSTPTPVRSEEHTSELQSLMRISYAVFCLKKKKSNTKSKTTEQL